MQARWCAAIVLVAADSSGLLSLLLAFTLQLDSVSWHS